MIFKELKCFGYDNCQFKFIQISFSHDLGKTYISETYKHCTDLDNAFYFIHGKRRIYLRKSS